VWQGGVPLVVYDPTDERLPMTIFAPLTTPKAQHMVTDQHTFGAGVKATAALIPAGWSQAWILSGGLGINEGFQAWGDRVLALSGKRRADPYRDATHATIGYWTDNGGYYHYSTGNGSRPAANGSMVYARSYEEVLPEVKASHDAAGVPFGHWQFDSWFYPKDGRVTGGGGGGGVTNWTADPAIFPSGMAAINRALGGMPMVMHNRQWSPISDYVRHLNFTWWAGPQWAVPTDPTAFFRYFFTQQQGWGLTMYEQDWMCTEYDGVGALQTNLSLADEWLAGMAAGAAAANLSVQYCMPYAHDILSGAAHAAVTNARATDDYVEEGQWAIGGTALFYWALGILPFKDGFYSSTLPQLGGQTVGPERNPDREALMATLSAAMVAPMDGLGLLNASRVMTSCRSDGVVLKPDVPLTTSDWCWRRADPTCLIYHTYSDVRGLGRAYYLYSDAYLAYNASLLPRGALVHVWHDWYSGRIGTFSTLASEAPSVGYEGHMYVVATPVLRGGWALLGEVGKYVPLSSKRFRSVSFAEIDAKIDGEISEITEEIVELDFEIAQGGATIGDGPRVEVVGVAGEAIEVCAAYGAEGAVLTKVCLKASFTAAATTQTLAFSRPSARAA